MHLCVVCSVRTASVTVGLNPEMINSTDASTQIQMAMKNVSANFIFYFSLSVEFELLLADDVLTDVNAYASAWKSMNESLESSVVIKGMLCYRKISAP
jgi:hypothetical protein